MRTKLLSPFWMPIYLFALGILIGSILLHLDAAHPGEALSWTDCFFTATSAICVTGLIVVDTGSFFSPFGQGVILLLIQLGGLGIMTYTSLVLYLLGQRVSLTDRMAVGYILLMFVGRLGPVWLLSALQSWQRPPHYRLPEDSLPLG